MAFHWLLPQDLYIVCFFTKGVGRDTFEEFIRTFKDSEKYIVSELPSPMFKDIMVCDELRIF